MTIEFLSATRGNLINKSAPRIVADEIDAYPPLARRREGAARRPAADLHPAAMLLRDQPSRSRRRARPGALDGRDHGDLRRQRPAGLVLALSALRRWSSPNPWGSRVMAIDYPAEASLDEIEAAAAGLPGQRLPDRGQRAPGDEPARPLDRQRPGDHEDGAVEGERVDQQDRRVLDHRRDEPLCLAASAAWRAPGPRPARSRRGARRRPARRCARSCRNNGACPTSRRARSDRSTPASWPSAPSPALRSAWCPAGVRFLTVAIDCQLSHFDWLARGWGVAGESWIVARAGCRRSGDGAEDWDRLFAK
jgi:hypothetical protein